MLAAVVDDDGEIVAREKRRSERGGNDAVVAAILDTIDAALAAAGARRGDVRACGVGVPAPIDAERGVVLDAPNLDLADVPLGALLGDALGCSVTLENDVNAGLWGEFVAGAARGYRHIVGIFPGTGIGGALILDGHLYRGRGGAAGEVGHITVQRGGRRCGCGNRGCLETLASRTAIARDAAVLAANGSSPTLAAAGLTDIRKLKSRHLREAIDAGDEAVAEVVRAAAEWLGVGMAALVNTFDPELVVLGGGLIEKLEREMMAPAVEAMIAHAMPRIVEGVEVRAASLGDDAVALGAAAIAQERASADR